MLNWIAVRRKLIRKFFFFEVNDKNVIKTGIRKPQFIAEEKWTEISGYVQVIHSCCST